MNYIYLSGKPVPFLVQGGQTVKRKTVKKLIVFYNYCNVM